MLSLPGQRWLICVVGLVFLFVAVQIFSIVHSDSFEWQHFSPSPISKYLGLQKTKLQPPDHYQVQPPDEDERCESHYGLPYLQHIADHHVSYCEDGSRSTMECFSSSDHDEVCIARGVRYQKTPPEGKKRWSMNCQLRNFTTEIASDPSKAPGLEGFRNVEDLKEYFFWTGAGEQLRQWDISKEGNGNGNGCNAKQNDKRYTLLVKREGNKNIWHKLMELWQSKLTLDALQMTAYGSSSGKPYLSPAQRKDVQVVFEDDDIGPVDSLWGLVTGSEPLRLSSLNDTCLGDVILPLAGSSSPFWMWSWEDTNCKSTYLLDPFIRQVYSHLTLPYKQRLTEDTVVTIINRTTTRRIYNIDSHVAKLNATFPDVTFQLIDFSKVTLRQQLEIISNTDVLIGAMGAGMTHIFFLPEQSTVVELMAPGAHYSGFRNLAKMRKLPYFTAHGVPEEEWNSAHGIPAQETSATPANTARSPRTRRHWQDDEYLYLSEEHFVALVAAAINAQLNRGTRSSDVKPH